MIKKISRFVSLAALFLIPIFPLIVANSYFFPFITGKAFLFRILVEVAFAGWLILAFLDTKYRPRITPLSIGITVFALITLVADLLGVSPIRSLWSNFERMEGWITIIHLWAFFMTAAHVFGEGEQGRRMWRHWISFELVIALAVAIYGIAQLLGWAAIHQGSSRIDASLGNAAYMAVYMLWNAGLAAYMFCVARIHHTVNANFLRWAYAILSALFAFEVFQTATRGTILGLAGGIMLACFLYAVLGKGEKRAHRWMAVGVIGLIIVIGGGLVLSKDTAFVKGNEILNRLATISWSEAQGQARNYIWPMAIKGFTERPILGWGQENFNYIFNANYNPKMWQQEQWFDRAHSVYFDWLTASGLIGLLSYLSLYVLIIWGIWKSGMTLGEKSILTGTVAGYAVHNFFVFDNLASYVMFFAALGFVNSFMKGKHIDWLHSKTMSADTVEYIAAPAVIVLLVASLYVFNVRPMQANTGLIAALQNCGGPQPTVDAFKKVFDIDVYVANQEAREQIFTCTAGLISNQQTPGPTKQAFYELTQQAIDAQIAATPMKDARIYTLAGSYYDAIGQYDKAEQYLKTASELSPGKQSISMELANSYLNNGKAPEAVKILEETYNMVPENTRARDAYALSLVVAGQDDKAHELFGNDPVIFETQQMAQAFMLSKQYAKGVEIYKKLLAAGDVNDMGLNVQLAQAQYMAGQKTAAIATLRNIKKLHPEYKDQIEVAIKQVQDN